MKWRERENVWLLAFVCIVSLFGGFLGFCFSHCPVLKEKGVDQPQNVSWPSESEWVPLSFH